MSEKKFEGPTAASEKRFEGFQVDNVSPGAAQRNTVFAGLLTLTVDHEVLLVFDPLWQCNQYCLL